MNAVFARVMLATLCLAAIPAAGHAQMVFPSANRPPPGPAKPSRIEPKPDPKQRLDPGALLCRTEADLQQHEEAISARLDGKEVAEPVGCRPVRFMSMVAVLSRHGPARTQVRLPGPPEQTGWTDAVIRE